MSHSDIKTISISLEKNSCRSTLSLKGEELQCRRPPERALNLGKAGAGRACLQPICQIHVRSLRSQSPPCLSSRGLNREITGMDTALGACPAGAEGIAVGKSTNSPSFFFSRELTFASSAPQTCCLYNTIPSQYACAKNKFCESSLTSATSTSSKRLKLTVSKCPMVRRVQM